MELIFKPLEFFDGKYGVSECGKVKSIYTDSTLGKRRLTGNILKPQINHNGYEIVGMHWKVDGKSRRKKFFVHRLVGMAFVPNPHDKPQINHKDTNKRNNHYTNLEWATNKENSDHAQQHGLIPTAKPKIKKGYPKTQPWNYKAVINIETGEEYLSMKHIPGVNWKQLRKRLNGERRNSTNFRYKKDLPTSV